MAEPAPHHQALQTSEHEAAIQPIFHLEPQQAINLMKVDVRLAPDYLTPRAIDPHTFLPTDCDPVHIPASEFFDRVRTSMQHARSESEGQIKPIMSKDRMILTTVEAQIKSSLQQLTPDRAQQDYWNTFGPQLGNMPPNEQVAALIEARDIYTQRLELILAIREFQRLGQREQITFSQKFMDSLPNDQQMQRAQAILQVLNDATRAQIASLDTQSLPSTKSLHDQLIEVENILGWKD